MTPVDDTVYFQELADRAESMGLALRNETGDDGPEYVVHRVPYDNPDGSVDWITDDLFGVSSFLDGYEYAVGTTAGGDA